MIHVSRTVLAALCAVSFAGAVQSPAPPTKEGEARMVRARGGYSLEAEGATLGQVCEAIRNVTGCEVHADKGCLDLRITARLSPRPAARLLHAVARRAGVRLDIEHRIRRLKAAETGRPGLQAFAEEVVNLVTSQRVPVSELTDQIAARIQLESGVVGSARVFAPGLPLYRVLDQIARQVNAAWTTAVSFRARTTLDSDAEAFERMHSHFADLAALSPTERQEEIESDLRALDDLEPAKRTRAAERIARDIASLATFLHRIPGEHRDPVTMKCNSILEDYGAVLRGQPDRRTYLDPIITAFQATVLRIKEIR